VKAVCVSVEGEEYTPGIKVNRKMILFPTGWDVKGKKKRRGDLFSSLLPYTLKREKENRHTG
jgi:hypothetical protein